MSAEPPAQETTAGATVPANEPPAAAMALDDTKAPSEALPEATAVATAPVLDDVVVAAAGSTRPAAPSSGGRPALPPAQPPGTADLQYEVLGRTKGLRYSADAQLRWQSNGARYTAELEITAFLLGTRMQTSSGRLSAQGLAPERFGDRRRGTEKATHFDQAGQRIRYSSNAPDSPLLPGAQDRLSVFLQLAALLNARPADFQTGQVVQLQVAGSGDAEIWSFQVGPEETLTLPAGPVSGRRLTRPPRRDHDNTVDIWLAPSLQHLPVRIRITEQNGDVADQLLRQLPHVVQ